MADLHKVVDDIASPTVIEAAELSRLLEERRGSSMAASLTVRFGAAVGDDPEAWIAAELIALQRDAVRLAKSLDDTLAYVATRCEAIRARA